MSIPYKAVVYPCFMKYLKIKHLLKLVSVFFILVLRLELI